jgi:hypothetical protein
LPDFCFLWRIAFVLLVLLLYLLVRKFEDTKRIIRSRKWKDRQHNGQKKKIKSTNNDLENIKQNTKDWATRNPLKKRKWNQVLRKTKQFLLYMWHPSCYSYYKHDEYCWNKMENRKFHTVVKIPNSNRKIVEKRAQAQIHDMLTFLAWYRHFNKKWRG